MAILKKETKLEDLDAYDQNYAIVYDGYVQKFLNPIRTEEQMVFPNSEQFEELKQAYLTRLKIFQKMEITTNSTHLEKLDALYEKNEFHIQELFNFEPNKNFHKFWKAPNCTCNKDKNMELYPEGKYEIDPECPVHKHRLK